MDFICLCVETPLLPGLHHHVVGAMQSTNPWAGRSAHEYDSNPSNPRRYRSFDIRNGLKIVTRSPEGAGSVDTTSLSTFQSWLRRLDQPARDLRAIAVQRLAPRRLAARLAQYSIGADVVHDNGGFWGLSARAVLYPLAGVALTTLLVLVALENSSLKF